MFASATRVHRNPAGISLVVLSTAILMAAGACKRGETDPAAGAPPPAKVTTAYQAEEFSVDRPDQYPTDRGSGASRDRAACRNRHGESRY